MNTANATDRVEDAARLAEAFTGWHRQRGGPWLAVCRAETRSACWAQLLVVLPLLSGAGGDSMVRRTEDGSP